MQRDPARLFAEAAAAGLYHNDLRQASYPRVQIITIQEMINGKRPQMPPPSSPFAQAPLERERAEQLKMES